MKVYVVVAAGNIAPLHVCEDHDDALRKAKEVPHGTVWAREVEEPRLLENFRVWVRLELEGPTFFIERRMSIPMVFDVFEPMEGGAKMHGSITVEAVDEGEAIKKARGVMESYMGESVLRTRPLGSVGFQLKMPNY